VFRLTFVRYAFQESYLLKAKHGVYILHSSGYLPTSYANRESGHLNNSPPVCPAADEAGLAIADDTGLDLSERLESSITHLSGNGRYAMIFLCFCLM